MSMIQFSLSWSEEVLLSTFQYRYTRYFCLFEATCVFWEIPMYVIRTGFSGEVSDGS